MLSSPKEGRGWKVRVHWVLWRKSLGSGHTQRLISMVASEKAHGSPRIADPGTESPASCVSGKVPGSAPAHLSLHEDILSRSR